jgi:hypothetical protein
VNSFLMLLRYISVYVSITPGAFQPEFTDRS